MNNKLNELIADGVKNKKNVDTRDRQCVIKDGLATVLLHGQPCIETDYEKKTITINGNAHKSRKTVRLLNTILSLMVNDRVFTRKGMWLIVNERNDWKDFSGKQVTLNYN